MCHLDDCNRNHSGAELSGSMSQYNIGSAQSSSNYDLSDSNNYSSSRQYGG